LISAHSAKSAPFAVLFRSTTRLPIGFPVRRALYRPENDNPLTPLESAARAAPKEPALLRCAAPKEKR
jgi:hypothetical protein